MGSLRNVMLVSCHLVSFSYYKSSKVLKRKTALSDNDNCFLFQAVQQYIKDSGRF